MNARNRVFIILGVLTIGSLIWYLLTTRRSADLQLIGTVDANEVIVSSKIPGRIQTMTVEEGDTVKAGELIEVEWMQMVLAALGGNVFYFLSAPIWHQMLGYDPFDEEVLRARRVAIVEFLGQAIFQDRQQGAKLAQRVLADSPMPECADFKGPISKV